MSDLYTKVQSTAGFIQNLLDIPYTLSITFGTGFNPLISKLPISLSIPYNDIPHMPTSTVPSHQSQLHIAQWHGNNVLIWAGRFHYYEGYTMKQVTYPSRVAWALGAKDQIFTNASGAVNRKFKSGDLVMVKDHINFFPSNPLRGIDDPRLGERFPDMTSVYDVLWRAQWEATANKFQFPIHEGVYLGLTGPNLETPAEYRMFRTWGADVIGMSTIPEVIVAHSLGCRTGVLSIISNVFDVDAKTYRKTTVEEIIKTVNHSSIKVYDLLDYWIGEQYQVRDSPMQ